MRMNRREMTQAAERLSMRLRDITVMVRNSSTDADAERLSITRGDLASIEGIADALQQFSEDV